MSRFVKSATVRFFHFSKIYSKKTFRGKISRLWRKNPRALTRSPATYYNGPSTPHFGKAHIDVSRRSRRNVCARTWRRCPLVTLKSTAFEVFPKINFFAGVNQHHLKNIAASTKNLEKNLWRVITSTQKR